MAVKERLKEYLSSKKISKTDFGKTIGVSSAYVTSMRKSITPEKLESIASNYCDLNIGWLLTGKGEMIISDVKQPPKECVKTEDRLLSLIESQQRTIEKQQESLSKLLQHGAQIRPGQSNVVI